MKKIRFTLEIREEINELLKRKAKECLISKNTLINLILGKEIDEIKNKQTKNHY